MAPSTTSPGQLVAVKREPRSAGNSREPTPTITRPKAKNEAQLATSFKTDLTDIRTLVTCTICDQLLYEPYTLGCGHTYCYSCMCSWFTTNRRKKTCPECRARVTIAPSPNFLVKQMVDQIFTKRKELMPADESIEQHAQRRAEEIATVDEDRNGLEGLFKGLFSRRRVELMVDEADGGIMRCPGCGHEHEGGPVCQYCGLLIENPYGVSDWGDDLDQGELDEEEIDLDLQDEVGAEFYNYPGGHFNHGQFASPFLDVAARNHGHRHLVHHNHIYNYFQNYHPDSPSAAEDSSSALDAPNDDDDNDSIDSDDSLNDFVVQDDEPRNRPAAGGSHDPESVQSINLISDDDSDEGGAISNRRPRHRNRAIMSPVDLESQTPSDASASLDGHQNLGPGSSPFRRSPSILTVTDTDTNGSELGDQAELLRRSGWSPLDHGNDSDAEGADVNYGVHRYGNFDTDDEDGSDNSDTGTETATENRHIDEDGRFRDSLSQTPVPFEDHYQSQIQAGTNFFDGNPYGHQEDTDNESEILSVTDHDGDTEMTPASPRSRDSRSVSANPYYNRRSISRDFEGFRDVSPKIERSVSISTTESSEGGDEHGGYQTYEEERNDLIREFNRTRNNRQAGREIGPSNALHQVEAESSDSSIRPVRRSRRPQTTASVQQQYNPRISSIMATHQAMAASTRGSQENPISFGDWNEADAESDQGGRIVEPSASRTLNPAHNMTAYRNMPARRVDPLRSSRSPSSTRVISSSQRNNRLPRQYSRRG
ncbi:uncharacterized protein RCO7_06109 [Rhynchosporium graminicola]|uniref:RING-type domain-containing protein n=1 Tax=Rhynchosporium graminicola TaxID=2792576 RepID=A0A1E1KZ34_9HELO|nr:uncharacterized protein RCO7_06109 [Rhynchosporium commune]